MATRVRLVLLAAMAVSLIAAPAQAFGPPWAAWPAVAPLSAAPSVWEPTRQMVATRSDHAAVPLADGRVLVMSGFHNTDLTSAEIYDSGTNAWRATGRMHQPHSHAAVARLSDGRVLVAGGGTQDSLGTSHTAEIYDPSTGSWALASRMGTSRTRATAVTLADGRVLVVGGIDSSFSGADAEVYSPATDTWGPAGDPQASGSPVAATLLPDGRVLVVELGPQGVGNGSYLYDPDADGNPWRAASSMREVRYGPAVAQLPDGRVLAAGGSRDARKDGTIASAEIFDPADNRWHATAPLSAPRWLGAAVATSDGSVVVAGGFDQDAENVLATERYDPADGSWTTLGDLQVAHSTGVVATPLPSGGVLVIGGTHATTIEAERLTALGLLEPGNGFATRDRTPTIAGDSSSDDEVTVTIHAGADLSGPVVQTLTAAPSNGSWSVDATAPLDDGSYTAVARQDEPGTASGPHTFTVGDVPPDTTIADGPPAQTRATTARFTLTSAARPATFECRLDGGDWTPCSDPARYDELAPGQHTFAVRAIDAAGNTDGTPATATWTIDHTAPTARIDSRPPEYSDSTSAELTFSADEPATFECSIDAVELAPCASPYTLHDLPDGMHRFRLRATDLAGNVSAVVRDIWVSDVTPPEPFGVDAPAEGAFVTPSSTFTWDRTEDVSSFVRRYELLVDGASVATVNADDCCSATPDTPLPEGAHQWAVRAVDRAGNSRDTASRSIVVDGVPPEPFALQAPADGAYATSSRPELTWDAASDVGVGLAHYVVTLDGTATTLDAASTSFTPDADLTEGAHVWHVDAVDVLGNVRHSAERTFKVDLTAPSARLSDGSGLALTGAPVTFDASGSTDSVGPLTDFAWDLDGDGTFETDTGTVPSASRTYPAPAELRIAVRVSDAAGRIDTTSVPLSVRAAPPDRPPGVSINSGAIYTNRRDVTLTLAWPQYALDVTISNDGGFADAKTAPLAPEIPWRLASSGAEGLPKTVYVHYRDGLGTDKAFQDDIILDETAPTVSGASTNGSGRGLRLHVRAHDSISGVATLQLARDRSAPETPRPFKATIVVHRAPRFVRIRDAAGNRSRWRRVATVTPRTVRARVRAALRRLAAGPLRLAGRRLRLSPSVALPRSTTIAVVARSGGHRIGSRRVVTAGARLPLSLRLTRVPRRIRLAVAITPPVGPTQRLTRVRHLGP